MNELFNILWEKSVYSHQAVLDTTSGTSCNYGDLKQSVNNENALMKQKDVQEGSVILILGDNSLPMLIVLLACIELNCRILILNPRIHGMAVEQKIKLISPDFIWDSNGWHIHNKQPESLLYKELPGLFFLTSGTEGTPKIVPRTYAQIKKEYELFTEGNELKRGVKTWTHLPLGHAFAFGCAFISTMGNGGLLCLSNSFLPNDIAQNTQDLKPNLVLTVPYIIKLFTTRTSKKIEKTELFLVSGGALSPNDAKAFHENYGTPLSIQYGSSETGPISINRSSLFGYDSVGLPYPGVNLKIDNENYIHIKSPAMSNGYCNDESLNKLHFSDGWFIPGDQGEIDSNMSLKIVGRSKMFNVGGLKVSAKEVESVLLNHPSISACKIDQVVNGDSDHLIAYIVTSDESLSIFDLKSYCSKHMEKYKIPSQIITVSKLPEHGENWKVRELSKDTK
jgi:long-chain acyl-CoA synthetase